MKKDKGGRPGKYYTHVEPRLIEIEGWARDGLVDEQISKNLGVAYSTFKTYKKKYSDLIAALKKGKEVVDREVENALLNNAKGYDYIEEQAIKIKNVYYEEGMRVEKEEIRLIEIKKHKPAETTAQIFWLKNRKPKDWRDKQDINHSGNMEINNPLKGLTTEELKKLIK